MNCPEIEIADAVVAELNGTAFNPAFTAVRDYLTERAILEGSATLRCVVMSVAADDVNDSRGEDRETHKVGIAIFQKLAATDKATLDPLVRLCRDVRKRFRRFSAAPGVTCKARDSSPLYDPDYLQSKRVFLAFIELEFELIWSP